MNKKQHNDAEKEFTKENNESQGVTMWEEHYISKKLYSKKQVGISFN